MARFRRYRHPRRQSPSEVQWRQDLSDLRKLSTEHPEILSDAYSRARRGPMPPPDPMTVKIIQSMMENITFDYSKIDYAPLQRALIDRGECLSNAFGASEDEHPFAAADVVTILKGTSVYKGGSFFFDPRDCPPSAQDFTWAGTSHVAAMYAHRFHGGITAYRMRRDASFLRLTERSIRWLLSHCQSEDDRMAIQRKWGVGLSSVRDQIMLIHDVLPDQTILYYPNRHPYLGHGACKLKGTSDLNRSFGHGVTDRMAARAVANVFTSTGVHGILDGWYSPIQTSLLSNAFSEELLVFGGAGCPLSEDMRDPLHWRNWVGKLEALLGGLDVRMQTGVKNFKFAHDDFRMRNFMIPRFIDRVHKQWPGDQFDLAWSKRVRPTTRHHIAIHEVNSLKNINALKSAQNTLSEILELHAGALVVLLNGFPMTHLKVLEQSLHSLKLKKGGWRVKYFRQNDTEDEPDPDDIHINVLLVQSGARIILMDRPADTPRKQAGPQYAIVSIGRGKRIILPNLKNGEYILDRFGKPLPPNELTTNLRTNSEHRRRYLRSIIPSTASIVMVHLSQDVDGTVSDVLSELGFSRQVNANDARNRVSDHLCVRGVQAELSLLPYPFTGFLPVVASISGW